MGKIRKNDFEKIEAMLDTAFIRLMRAYQALSELLEDATRLQRELERYLDASEEERQRLVDDIQAVHLAIRIAAERYEQFKQNLNNSNGGAK
jgi:single-stranded DNA-specific DHH superfamily exonuclease